MTKYPHGKIDPTDQGELNIAVYIKDHVLIMDFGENLSWVGLTKKEIEPLIKLLQEKLKLL